MENVRKNQAAGEVAFVHATPGNFFKNASLSDVPARPAGLSQENPVPVGWARSKELAAAAAAAVPPGFSLSDVVGKKLANGLRRPSALPVTPSTPSKEI